MKLRSLLLCGALALTAGSTLAAGAPRVEVFKSPWCGCCGKWVEHMRAAGFDVVTKDVEDVPGVRRRLGMPEAYGSCHTAKVGGYLVEGHVPAADVKRLLKEKPAAIGLAAPGMPAGSPGMEGPEPVAYDTLLVKRDASSAVFARH